MQHGVAPGVYRGICYDNKDPEGRQRIRATVPTLFGDQPTDWMWQVAAPHGMNVIPQPGEGVWVLFEGGSTSHPVWIGTFSEHRHVHPETEVTNLTTDLANRSLVGHSHAEGDIGGLATDLANKANVVHTHVESDVTNLITDLASASAGVVEAMYVHWMGWS